MAKLFEFKNGNKAFPEMLKYLEQHGEVVSPRGLETREIMQGVTVIKNPTERFQTLYSRGGNPYFLVAEALAIMKNINSVEFLDYYNCNMKQFSDNGRWFHGFYGTRMLDYNGINQFDDVIKKLEKDSFSRQAVINLYDPIKDNSNVVTKDIPCNNLSYLKIRNNKLLWTQVIRSNDLVLGLFPTNLFQWSTVAECIAGCLNVELEQMTFLSDSLHYYTNSDIAKKCLNETRKFDIYDYCNPIDARLSKKELEEILTQLVIQEELCRTGQRPSDLIKFENNYYEGWNLAIQAWSARKHKNYLQAIELVNQIKPMDMKVACMEFNYRNNKNENERKRIEDLFSNYPIEVINYLRGV